MKKQYQVGQEVWVVEGNNVRVYAIRSIEAAGGKEWTPDSAGPCYLRLKPRTHSTAYWLAEETFPTAAAARRHLASQYRDRAAALVRAAESLEAVSR